MDDIVARRVEDLVADLKRSLESKDIELAANAVTISEQELEIGALMSDLALCRQQHDRAIEELNSRPRRDPSSRTRSTDEATIMARIEKDYPQFKGMFTGKTDDDG